MPVEVSSARPGDLQELAALAARFQANPAWHSAHLGGEASGIAAEISAIDDWTAVSAVAREGNRLVGWILGEIDTELGRVWWLGPYGDPGLYDPLYDHVEPGPGIAQEEIAIDSRAVTIRDWAVGHGFALHPGSAVLSVALPLDRGEGADCRPITDADLELVGSLHERLFPESHLTGRQLVRRADDSKSRLLLERDGELVGYIAVERQPDGAGLIDFVGVHEDHRRHGHGRALVVRGAAELVAMGCREVQLNVRESNTGARALYASLGFIEERIVVPLRKSRATRILTLDS